MRLPNPKKVKIGPKIIDCVFDRFEYNVKHWRYWLFTHKSSIENIYFNIIMESINAILFENIFLFKKTHEIHSLKRTNKVSSNSHHQLEDDKVKPIMSKRGKVIKYLVLIFYHTY